MASDPVSLLTPLTHADVPPSYAFPLVLLTMHKIGCSLGRVLRTQTQAETIPNPPFRHSPSSHGPPQDLVLSTVAHFDNFMVCKKRVGMDDVLTYGAGLILLFYGMSGTGKTMLANALGLCLHGFVLLCAVRETSKGKAEPLKK